MKYIPAVLMLLTLAGCASLNDGRAGLQHISIETQASDIASVGQVTLRQQAGDLQVQGLVRNSPMRRSPAFGYVHVEALDADARVLQAVDAGYRRFATNAFHARFVATLTVDPATVAALRISHRTGREAAGRSTPDGGAS